MTASAGLPLPVAALLRRARNAKSPRDRHDAALAAWEVATKLRAAALPPRDPSALARPSLGHWVRAAEFDGEAALSSPALLAAHALFRAETDGGGSGARSVTARQLLDGLPAYRNALVGHGAPTRDAPGYEAAGRTLAESLVAAWDAGVFLPAGARLVYVEELAKDASGRLRARIMDLSGLAPQVEDPGGTPDVPESLLPQRVLLRTGDEYRDLHPWAVYDHDAERILLFNGVGRSVEYLGYATGEIVRADEISDSIAGQVIALIESGGAAAGNRHRPGAAEAERAARAENTRRALALVAASHREQGLRRSARSLLLARAAALRAPDEPDCIQALRTALVEAHERAVLRGHEAGVLGAVYSPDGALVLTWSIDCTARVWDAAGRTVAVARGHQQYIQKAAFSPDGTVFATASSDSTARVWSCDGSEVVVLRGHTGGLLSVAFAPGGQRVLTSSEDGTTRIWNRAGDVVAILGAPERPVWRAAYSPDGSRIVSAGSGDDAWISDALGRELAVLRGHEGRVRTVAFSPDGTRVVTASADRTARVWDASGAETAALRGHDAEVGRAAFSPDGTRILTYSDDGTARLWSLAGQSLAILRGHQSEITGAEFSPDGASVVTASRDGSIRVWGAGGRELLVLRDHANAVLGARFSPDGGRVLSASLDGTARVWDVTCAETAALRPGGGAVRSVEWTRDGQRLLVACDDRTVRIVDLAGRPETVFRGHQEGAVGAALAPDDLLLASCDSASGPYQSAVPGDGGRTRRVVACDSCGARFDVSRFPAGSRVRCGRCAKTIQVPAADSAHSGGTATAPAAAIVWDRTGRQVAALTGHKSAVRSVTFSPDGARILTGSMDRSVRLWDRAGNGLATIATPSTVLCAGFSPCGTRLAIASGDRTARILDLDGSELATLRGHEDVVHSAAFSPNGTRIVTASEDRTARVWDASGSQLAVLMGHGDGVRRAAFSPDGSRVATASADGTARLWEPAGRALSVLGGHTGAVAWVAFSPDGSALATSSEDGTVRLWLVHTADLLVLADTRVTRDFTAEELDLYADLLPDEAKERARKALEGTR